MTRSVTWNGITQFRPGGISRVNANQLNQINLGTNGIVGLIGEADGGEPGVIYAIDDSALAKETFRSGPLADALRVAFEPSGDTRVPGGSFRCLCIKVNQSTPAELILLGAIFPNAATFSAWDATTAYVVGNFVVHRGVTYVCVQGHTNQEPPSSAYWEVAADTTAVGCTTTVINLTTGGLAVDALIGSYIRINGEVRLVSTNAAGTITVGVPFSAPPSAGVAIEILSPMIKIISRDYGAHTNQIQFEYEPAVGDGQQWTTVFEGKSQLGDEIGGIAQLIIEYIGERTKVVQAAGVANDVGLTTTIDETSDAGVSFGTLTNYFVEAFGGLLVTHTNLRKIGSNTAKIITVNNAFRDLGVPVAPGVGAAYEVRTGEIRSGAIQAATANSLTLEALLDVAGNELQNMIVEITSGAGVGQRRRILANTDGLSSVLSVDHPWQTTPAAADTYSIQYNTQATASVSGALGVATGLTTTVARNGGAPATELNISFIGATAVTTLQRLVDTINANSNYSASIPNGVNGQTTLTTSLDFDSGHQAVEIGLDDNAVSTPPNPDANEVSTWPNHFRRDLQLVIDQLNSVSEQVYAERMTSGGLGTGAGRPEFTGGSVGTVGDVFQFLSGGTRGVSTNTDWQNAFDLLIRERRMHVVPLIVQDLANEGLGSTATWDSVAAQLVSHLRAGVGVEKNEGGGYIGFRGTKTQYIEKLNTFNYEDLAIVSQRMTFLDVDSNSKEMDEWVMAVAAAGMRSGVPEVGEPLTWKIINGSNLVQDASWDPRERTDANQLIQNGALFAEFIRGKGIRWVRDLTSYIKDDNLAYAEGSTRDVVRYVSYGLRTHLEDKFTGVKAKPTNALGIKTEAANWLEKARSESIIVDSIDENTGQLIHAYHNIRVTISGDIATVRVGIFPVVGINFQLDDIYLQLPTQAAA